MIYEIRVTKPASSRVIRYGPCNNYRKAVSHLYQRGWRRDRKFFHRWLAIDDRGYSVFAEIADHYGGKFQPMNQLSRSKKRKK